MMRHLITFAILLAALVMYARGFSELSLATLVAAGALECWFWVRLVRSRPAEIARAAQQP